MVRFSVKNIAAISQYWLLEVSYAFMENLDLFELHDNGECESIS